MFFFFGFFSLHAFTSSGRSREFWLSLSHGGEAGTLSIFLRGSRFCKDYGGAFGFFFFFGSLLFLIQRCLFLDLCCSARKQKSGRFRSVLCGGSEVRALLFFFVLVAEGIWILLLDASVLARELLVFGGGCQLSCADSRAPSSRHDALPCWSNIVLFCCCLWRRFCLEVRCGQGSSSALFFW